MEENGSKASKEVLREMVMENAEMSVGALASGEVVAVSFREKVLAGLRALRRQGKYKTLTAEGCFLYGMLRGRSFLKIASSIGDPLYHKLLEREWVLRPLVLLALGKPQNLSGTYHFLQAIEKDPDWSGYEELCSEWAVYLDAREEAHERFVKRRATRWERAAERQRKREEEARELKRREEEAWLMNHLSGTSST